MTQKGLRRALGAMILAGFLGMLVAGKVQAQAAEAMTDTIEKADAAKIGFGNGSIIVAPIPLKNPTLGSGLILTGGYLFQLDAKSDTSFLGAAAMRTSNGSQGLGVAANLSFGEGRWSILAMGGKAKANYSLYGLGNLRFDPVPLTQEGTFVRLAVGHSISDNFKLGIDAQYLDTKIRLREGTLPIADLADFAVGVRQVLVGPSLSYDSRDDTIYPTRGGYASLLVQRGFGLGRFDNRFTRGTLETKVYLPLGDRAVLALGGVACRVSQSTPFFNACGVGTTDGLRGYSSGQYFDDALVSAQAEFRYRLGGRWGVAAFAGASSLGEDLDQLGGALSAGGLGLRFRLSKSFPLDFSVDQTINRNGDSFTYVYLGQSF